MNSSVDLNNCGNDLEVHMRFVCPECGVEHQSQQEWRKHLNDQHCYNKKGAKDFDFKEINDKYHECQICFRKVANGHQSIWLLQYHHFLHLPYSLPYQCRHCEAAYIRRPALCAHLLRYHQIKAKPKKSNRQIEAEKMCASNPKENPEFYIRFICPECGQLFERFQQWINHINNAHYVTSITFWLRNLKMHRISNTQSHYCRQCRRLVCTDDDTILQRHSFTHLPYNKYFQCVLCTVKKTLKTDVLRHFIYAHTKEYERTKMHLKLPDEWGATITESCKLELQELMENGYLKNTKTETDRIQKALRENVINLAEEDIAENMESSKNYMTNESPSYSTSNTNNNDTINMDELDEMCEIFFEEIEEENPLPHIPTKMGRKLESNDDEKLVSLDIEVLSNNWNNSDIGIWPQRVGVKLNEEQTNNKPKCELEKHFKYLCPQCGEEFENQKLWRQHVFSKHDLSRGIDNSFRELDDKNCYLCLNCIEVLHTTATVELQRHYLQHMPYQSYLRCEFCNTTKSSKPKIMRHLESCHAQQIGYNLNTLQNKKPLQQQEQEQQQQQFKCRHCKKEFRSQARYQNHWTECVIHHLRNAKTSTLADNLKLLEHLRKARKRIRQYL